MGQRVLEEESQGPSWRLGFWMACLPMLCLVIILGIPSSQKSGPGRSTEVSYLQGDAGCQYLGPEDYQGYNTLTNFLFLG